MNSLSMEKNNIIYINYESFEFDELRDYKKLHDYIESKIKNDDTYYLLMKFNMLINLKESLIL